MTQRDELDPRRHGLQEKSFLDGACESNSLALSYACFECKLLISKHASDFSFVSLI